MQSPKTNAEIDLKKRKRMKHRTREEKRLLYENSSVATIVKEVYLACIQHDKASTLVAADCVEQLTLSKGNTFYPCRLAKLTSGSNTHI